MIRGYKRNLKHASRLLIQQNQDFSKIFSFPRNKYIQSHLTSYNHSFMDFYHFILSRVILGRITVTKLQLTVTVLDAPRLRG